MLTLILVGTLPFLALVVYVVSKKGIPLYTRLQETTDRMTRVVRENITGVRVIKALSKGNYEKNRFYRINQDVVDKELSAGTLMSITNPTINFLLNMGLTLVVVVGAYRVNIGASEPGKIVAFLSYFMIMLHAVMAITRIFIVFSKATASAMRIARYWIPMRLKEIDMGPVKSDIIYSLTMLRFLMQRSRACQAKLGIRKRREFGNNWFNRFGKIHPGAFASSFL